MTGNHTNDVQTDDVNEETLALLRRALQAMPAPADPTHPPPRSVIEGARWVHEWRNMDAELAELVFDSHENPELAGVRSTGSLRELTFVSGANTIEIEIQHGARTATVSGTVQPPAVGTMQLVIGGEVFADELGDSGHFSIEGVVPGTVLAFVETPDGKIRLGSFEV